MTVAWGQEDSLLTTPLCLVNFVVAFDLLFLKLFAKHCHPIPFVPLHATGICNNDPLIPFFFFFFYKVSLCSPG
jgi:hypothetical protein